MTGIGHMNKQQDIKRLLGQFFGFLLRVVRGFMRNQGLLLSGALAYFRVDPAVARQAPHRSGRAQLRHPVLR